MFLMFLIHCVKQSGTLHKYIKEALEIQILTIFVHYFSTEFGVFELGMNHTGELTELSRMVKPLVAVVTTVELAHLQFFSSRGTIPLSRIVFFFQFCFLLWLNPPAHRFPAVPFNFEFANR